MRFLLLSLLVLLAVGCGSPPEPSPTPSASPASPVEEEPSLVFRSGAREKSYSRSQLLHHSALQTLDMIDQSGYQGRPMHYLAVPVSVLVDGLELPPDSELHYQTRDGFSSSVEASKAVSTDPNKATAYIAVEDPAHPWPKFDGRDYTAGPFYLVWVHPEMSEIGREEWPFMLSSFTVEPSIASRYPGLMPAKKESPEYRGYKVFIKNCFPCHTLDGEGAGKMGPDLNVPQNPTQYLTDPALRQLIRDPRSVRSWPDLKMTGFDKDLISERKLDELIAYLRSRRRK